MVKYEYLCLSGTELGRIIIDRGYRRVFAWKRAVREQSDIARAKAIQQYFNELGAQGWELVCVNFATAFGGNTVGYDFHFKRPIEDNEDIVDEA